MGVLKARGFKPEQKHIFAKAFAKSQKITVAKNDKEFFKVLSSKLLPFYVNLYRSNNNLVDKITCLIVIR